MEAAIFRWMVAVTTVLVLFATSTLSAEIKTRKSQGVMKSPTRREVLKQCQGRFKDKVLTEEELKRVLDDHKVWVETYLLGEFDTQQAKSDPRKANLCGAELLLASLGAADLRGANLSGAVLVGANLSKAYLGGANLSGALLLLADLSAADLHDADLSKADFCGADLSAADLRGANLSGAYLGTSTLAEFRGANLSKALFEPRDLPDADDIASAMNLSQMGYKTNPQALVKLRKAFKEGGYYQQEREVTCAIQRNATWRLVNKGNFGSLVEAMFRYVFFDLTCQWGMVPGRALLILLTLIPVFAIPYVIALRLPGKNGIWRKWADDRMRLDLGTKEPVRLHIGWLQAPVLGFYFSVLSAFNIGWRELNVGNWIQRLQAKEYALKATGWVRAVSGVQSLISAYLLAIWALTYFGRPFE